VNVRLTRKFANRLNGVDVSAVKTGDVIKVSATEGAMLIAEGWAEQASNQSAMKTNETESSLERTD
jgi:hypothetical protein